MSKNTNRSRAARRLQEATDLTYNQALDVIRNAAEVPEFNTRAAVDAFLVAADLPSTRTQQFIARFVPQAWVNDHAIDVDPEGDITWDVTAAVWDLPDDYRAILEAEIEASGEALDVNDLLKGDPNAPDWVRRWRGPFSIWVSHHDTDNIERVCVYCGNPIEDDPEGSPGVVVHARDLEDTFELDADHVALDDTFYGN